MRTFILRGGRIIDPASGLDQTGDMFVHGANIETISLNDRLSMPEVPIIDCEGCIVAPGLIDIHVHFREPSNSRHEETIETGSISAASGGFTTVCTMPNTTPAIDSPGAIEKSIDVSNQVGVCRVLPTGSATINRQGETIAPIDAMASAGAIAITDDGDVVEHDVMMSAVLDACKRADLPFMQHCQDPTTTVDGVINEGEVQRELGYASWPRSAEESIIARDIELNESIGAKWHAQHISSGGSVDLIRIAKQNNQPISGEASPHHLLLTQEDSRDLGTLAKMNPPLREHYDIDLIKKGIADGTIEILATDHAPHPLHTKSIPFPDASFGVVGLDCALALYAKALIDDGVLDWPRMLAMMTIHPSTLIGRSDLGSLTVGGIADITIIDPNLHWTIDVEQFATTGRNCPFNGWDVKGKAIATIYGGSIVHQSLYERADHCNWA